MHRRYACACACASALLLAGALLATVVVHHTLLARHAPGLRDDVLVLVLTAAKNYGPRMQHMRRTWIADAHALGLCVQPYGSVHSALTLADALPGMLALDATDAYPPFDLRIKMIMQTMALAVARPELQWIVDVDDDTYVAAERLPPLLAAYDPRGLHVVGWCNTNEPAVIKRYCAGFACVYSAAVWRALAATGVTEAQLREELAAYLRTHAHFILGEDVFLALVLHKHTGVLCETRAGRSQVFFHADKGSPTYDAFGRTANPDTVGWHKLVGGACIDAIHAGASLAGCDAH